MYEYFKLSDQDKKELLSITERLKRTDEKNLAPKVMPDDVSVQDMDFASENRLPNEFFQFFTIERAESDR